MNASDPLLRGVYLFADNVPETVAFYELLGLTVEVVSDEFARFSWSNGSTLEIGSGKLTSSYDPSWQEPGDPSKNTISFEFASPEKVDEIYRRMVAAGYRSQLAPCIPPWRARFAIINDPDGNIVGLHGPRDVAADRAREQGES